MCVCVCVCVCVCMCVCVFLRINSLNILISKYFSQMQTSVCTIPFLFKTKIHQMLSLFTNKTNTINNKLVTRTSYDSDVLTCTCINVLMH